MIEIFYKVSKHYAIYTYYFCKHHQYDINDYSD
jgi:hypothetical protein